MRHNVKKSGLRKTKSKHKALRRNLLNSLFKHGYLTTTDKKAKILQPLAEKVIHIAKTKEPREAIRQLQDYFPETEVSKKLLNEIAPKYTDKNSGYTRLTKIGYRDGDGALVTKVELT
jgi:large subunit ribosomal protein L17